MKKLILLIPFLFILSCSSDDDSNDDNPTVRDSYLSFEFNDGVYEPYVHDSGFYHATFEPLRTNDVIHGYILSTITRCVGDEDNEDCGIDLQIDFSATEVNVGDRFTELLVVAIITDYGDFTSLPLQFGEPDFEGYVEITEVHSDGRVSGTFELHNLHRNTVGDLEPRTINITNGIFKNLTDGNDY